ncbi:MAG: hypothetical protein ACYT04_67000, partial [Nostoc sp.]
FSLNNAFKNSFSLNNTSDTTTAAQQLIDRKFPPKIRSGRIDRKFLYNTPKLLFKPNLSA